MYPYKQVQIIFIWGLLTRRPTLKCQCIGENLKMFTTAEKIDSKTGKNKVGRFAYLKLLSEEFKTTKSLEAKQQVIANLANFAYDPINYEHLRTLGVLDIFLGQLNEDDETLTQFALGGLCNSALDVDNKEHIISSGGIALVSRFLCAGCAQSVVYAITTLMFLVTAKHRHEIASDGNIARMLQLAEHPDQRVQNVAKVFLMDYCASEQVQRVRNAVAHIPLPDQPSDQPSTSQDVVK